MSEIDLIPRHYRQLLWLRRALRYVGLMGVVVAVSVSAAKVNLVRAIDVQEDEIARLDAERSTAKDQRSRLEELKGEESLFAARLRILEELRGPIPAKAMFVVIDEVLDGEVWFVDWHFRRAGELVEKRPEAVQTGYFLIVPEADASGGRKAWRLRTHMEIHARATDYSALAGFVRRLVARPEIEDVRVLQTRTVAGRADAAVDFELAVVVAGRA